MIDLDEIRKEVAIKNGILLDKADPQLTMVTINQMLLDKAVATLNAQNIEHQKKTVEAVVAVMAESLAKEKETAGRVITEGTDYVTDQVKAAVKSAMDDAEGRFWPHLNKALFEIRDARRITIYAAMFSAACATVVLLSLIKHL